jgi:hypothetical protein
MDDIEYVSARGRGRWGANLYQVELLKNVVTRTSSTGRDRHSITAYHVLIGDRTAERRVFETDDERTEYWQQATSGTWFERFERDKPDLGLGARVSAGDAVVRRGFDTEEERSAFLSRWMPDLDLEPLEPPELRYRRHALASVVGEDLVFVTFVRNYVQLNFGGPSMNFYVWPRIRRDGMVLRRPDPGYADSLLALINVHVVAVDELLDLGLVIEFEDDTRLTLPLDGTDTEGPEVAEFPGPDGYMVWRPEDEPVRWLGEPD